MPKFLDAPNWYSKSGFELFGLGTMTNPDASSMWGDGCVPVMISSTKGFDPSKLVLNGSAVSGGTNLEWYAPTSAVPGGGISVLNNMNQPLYKSIVLHTINITKTSSAALIGITCCCLNFLCSNPTTSLGSFSTIGTALYNAGYSNPLSPCVASGMITIKASSSAVGPDEVGIIRGAYGIQGATILLYDYAGGGENTKTIYSGSYTQTGSNDMYMNFSSSVHHFYTF